MQHFYIANNQNLANAKLSKILPKLEKLKIDCHQSGMVYKFRRIDECIMLSHSLRSRKQFIEKQVKFEYKM